MEKNSITSQESDRLYNISTLEKIKNLKGAILKAAVWIFVAGVVIAAFLLLLGDLSNSSAIGKLVATLFTLGLMLMVTVFDFQKIEEGDKGTQVFATMGAISNVVWALLWTGTIWGVFDFLSSYSLTPVGKMTLIASSLSGLGLFGSAVLSIKEYNKKGTIRPLKITSVICLTYEVSYFILLTINGFRFDRSEIYGRLGALAGLAGFVWFISALIAIVISKRERALIRASKNQELIEKGKQVEAKESSEKAAIKTDDELRAEIEEKVRREMIEKEVRERLEKEKLEKKD